VTSEPGATSTRSFLFTDIEGSTSLWENRPDRMRLSLLRHDQILRSSIEEHRGKVVKTVGDAFIAVFGKAADALQAAIAGQRALHTAEWPDDCRLRVRMAVHAGDALEERDADYFGPTVNRAARLLAAGHGGQIVVSAAALELAGDALPGDVVMRDLGSHLLKDLVRPEHIYQVVAPDLTSDFPPLRTLSSRHSNLPAQTTPFVGRQEELAELRRLVTQSDVRLLTLLGPGGIGKTRLALQCAAEVSDDFENGAVFVTLSAVSDPALLPSAIAEALHLQETGDVRPLDAVLAHLRGFRLLLVLDNFEQIVEAAGCVGQLLRECPGLTALATSRELLRIGGEHTFHVPTLSLPDVRAAPDSVTIARNDAVRLFVERAHMANSGFRLTDSNAGSVAAICIKLEGLPLALELAAARVRMLPPDALLARLQSRLGLLTGGGRDLPARQQTLRATIDWSYHLLAAQDQLLFARLATFAGGCTLESAEAICNGDLDVFDGMASLVDKSLLRQEEGERGDVRFVMLETVREYAMERLRELEDQVVVGRRHTEYFLRLAEEAHEHTVGPRQREWLDRLEEEHGNLRLALRRSIDDGDVGPAVRIARALYNFWRLRVHLDEADRWMAEILPVTAAAPPQTRADAHRVAALVAWQLADLDRAEALFQRARGLYLETGDRRGLASCTNGLGTIAHDRGQAELARRLYEESLGLFRELDLPPSIAIQLGNLAGLSIEAGELGEAERLLTEALALHRGTGDPDQIAGSFWDLSQLAIEAGDTRRAKARTLQAFSIWHDIGYVHGAGCMLEQLASLFWSERQAEPAVFLYAAAAAYREREGVHLAGAQQTERDRILGEARASLGDEACERIWEEGWGTAPREAPVRTGLDVPASASALAGG